MDEFKTKSESSYSEIGERSASRPITLSFQETSAEQMTSAKPYTAADTSAMPAKPKPKKKAGKILGICAAGLLLVGVSFGSGALGAYLLRGNTAPAADTQKSAINSIIASQTAAAASPAESGTKSVYTIAAEKAKPSVVEITTESVTTASYFQQYVIGGAGSGVIISSDGYIITNHHVVEDASKITVRLANGTEYGAALIGSDAEGDIAVLKINAEGLPYAVIGDSSKLLIGEEVLAIGNPLGKLGGSVTNGIVSALDREITIDGQKMTLLQTNAAINPGNSGGGLFNLRGELVAIVNAKSAGSDIEGLGFAIPINYAYEIAEELLEKGYVSGRPALGIIYIAIDDYMDLMRYRVNAYGVYVYDGGDTGLKNGDRITRIGDYDVPDEASLKSAIQNYKVGDKVTVSVVRGGTYTDIEITLTEKKPAETQLELTTEQ